MSAAAHICVEEAEDAAYDITLRNVQAIASAYPSWEAMMAEEKNDSLSATRPCTTLPTAPERSLLSTWLLATTARYPKTKQGTKTKPDRTTTRRWTRFLGLWIALRLAGLIAHADDPDAAQLQGEVEAYEQSFLCVAWPLLMTDQRLRIKARIAHLRRAYAAASPRSTASAVFAVAEEAAAADGGGGSEDGDSYDAVCGVLCNVAMRASQSVARDYLRITWDVFNPNQAPAVVDARLQSLCAAPPEQRRRHSSKLARLPSDAAATRVLHAPCLAELVAVLPRTLQQHHTADHTYRVWMRVVRTALLQIGYNLVVKARAGMIDACYCLLPALVDFEACVTICEVMECEKASAATSPTDAEPGDEEETMKRDQLRRTLAALVQCTFSMYNSTIHRLLLGYRKSCTSSATPPRILTLTTTVDVSRNPLVSAAAETASGSHHSAGEAAPLQSYEVRGARQSRQQRMLSQAAYALLVEVVEPTCAVLRRCPSRAAAGRKAVMTAEGAVESAPPPTSAGRETGGGSGGGAGGSDSSEGQSVRDQFVRFFETKVTDCFAAALSGKADSGTSKANQQATMDAELVTAYLAAALR